MKKLLLSSGVLCLFSASIFLFEISCKKSADAQTSTISQPLGIILFEKTSKNVNSTGVITDLYQFWIANFDGSNQHQIPVTLPSTVSYYGNNAYLSPDGKKLFISAI